MSSVDLFDKAEKLLKELRYDDLLSVILNDAGTRIVTPYNSDLNHSWYLVGHAYFKKGMFEDALKAYKRSYRYWKKDAMAIRQIGLCYSELGNPKTAKYYYLKALVIKENQIINYNLGNAYFDMGKYDLAIREYKKVKNSDKETYNLAQSNIGHATYNLGNLYFDMKKYDLAIREYKQVKKSLKETYANAQENIKLAKKLKKKKKHP